MTASCGTVAAASAHWRNGEPLDPACHEARKAYNRDWYRAKRATTPRRQHRSREEDRAAFTEDYLFLRDVGEHNADHIAHRLGVTKKTLLTRCQKYGLSTAGLTARDD